MLLVLKVVTLVALPIRPDQHAITVHLVLLPHAAVLAPVAPPIRAFALDIVRLEVPHVEVPIGP